MARAAVDELLYLLDRAFEADGEHSLLGNLRRVGPDDWTWLPPDGSRSIRTLVGHVGACKLMYENHAFGDASLRWQDIGAHGGEPPPAGRDWLSVSELDARLAAVELAAPEPAIAWLRAAHARLRDSVAALDDAELARPRPANWGKLVETRTLIAVMIAHDYYHAGEINHLRALRQRDDG
jgi:hypothetical protein